MRSRKSENKVEITALSQHLVGNHVMETSVKKELEEYQTRSQDLDKKVMTHYISYQTVLLCLWRYLV